MTRAARTVGQSPLTAGTVRNAGSAVQSPFGAGLTRPTAGAQTMAARPAPTLPPRSGGAMPPAPSTARTPGASARPNTAAAPSGTLFRKDMKITDEEFLHIRDFIYEQCGIFIAENRKYLIENRLSHRIKELHLKSFNEYYKFLRYDANRQKELTHLFEVITTNETSFFRNPPQLEAFQNIILPDILDWQRKSGNKKLRIWSAGCSTGEEPYTLAIIICEVLKSELASWDVAINAYDLSEAVLAAARRGIYNAYTLRTTPKEIVARYFTQDGNQYAVKPELKRLIRFAPINLNDKEQCKKVEKSQIVFCRNVIIYFDDAMKRRVINAFYDNLEPHGVLLIGHSETLHNISRAFQLEHHTGTIVYRKGS
ncbi:MAG: protein-glutamate O-methyltransferase CheR [Desulfovibrio sp.]|nr:protein-glutamate O-methyltransferase CheR [Desulfovibrio sp.]